MEHLRTTLAIGALAASAALVAACGHVSTPAETSGRRTVVELVATPPSVQDGGASTLSWVAAHATSCMASGGWSGTRAPSGRQSVGPLHATVGYTLVCNGPDGTAADIALVTVPSRDGLGLPLHTEAGKRYLVDARGQPFLLNGDTAWSLIVRVPREDADLYLEDRRQKGYNAILVNLIEHARTDNPPNNFYGAGPFLVPGDFSTPNEAYFAHAEYVIAKAREKGMLVLLTPAYMGYGGGSEGWYQEMTASGESKLRAYGQYLANRFKAYDNILWVEGGDFNPPEKTLLRAVANGIRDVSPASLQTFHGSRHTSALSYLGTAEPWLSVNDIYTDENTVVSEAFTEYARATMPFFLVESRYEDGGANEVVVRTQAYQTVLSGGTGHMAGNNPVWEFSAGWKAALNTPGIRSLANLRSLFESMAWWTLQPDTGSTLLTAGIDSAVNRAVAARSSTGTFAVLYTPGVRTLTVNLAQLSGPNVRARWYDPTSAAYTTVAGSPFPASGSRTFTPTGNNANGFGDWVLVLESTP